MKKLAGIIVFVSLLCVSGASAEEKAQGKFSAPAAQAKPATQDAVAQDKDALIANVSGMRNQEVRVAVLQQLLSEEVAKLRNVQALFCDQYKLDVEKLRKGEYMYDEKLNKFVERPAQEIKK